MEPARQTFGRYEIVRPLGAGGMGEILLARQPGLPGVQRLVVIKKILPHLAQEPGFIERFLDESRVAASLSHGNIVQVHEVGEEGGEYFMAMEYVEGMDLKEAFHRLRVLGRRVPEDLALYVLVEVAKALAYAHEKRGDDGKPLGIVHRDVSPANLLLSLDGQVKLADFGVAKATLRLSLTIPGTLHGKVYYMSPEQVAGEECDPRSDVFSLGVVAYEMLAGRRPFEGASEVAVIDQVRRCEPPPLQQVAPWVPGSLAALVAKALCKDPAGRYGTMDAFRQALTTYMLEAHTMVSARALADFLGGLQDAAPPRAPAAPTPLRAVSPRSLDEVAASLLAGGEGTPSPLPGPTAPHTRTVAAAARGEAPAGTGTAPGTGGTARRSKRERARKALPWMALAVGLLGLGAGAWAWTVVRDLARPTAMPAPESPAGTPVAALPAGGSPEGTAVPATAGAPEAAPAATGGGAATAPAAAPGTDAPPAREAAPGAAPVPGTPEAAGTARDGTAPPAGDDRPGPRRVLLRSDPPGATVRAGDRDLGRTPLEVTVPAGGLRLDLSAPDRGPRTVTLGAASPATVTVPLPPAPGRVKFRFFPADAQVRIDGQAVEAQGNLVDRELPAGGHVLVLASRDGSRRREMPFDVSAGQVRALGTVELEDPPPPAPPAAPPEPEGGLP